MTFNSLLTCHHYVVTRGVRHRTGGVLCRVQCRLSCRGPDMQRVRILPVLLIQVTSHIIMAMVITPHSCQARGGGVRARLWRRGGRL